MWFFVERHWLDEPVSIVIQLLITLIPPCLFLTVCFFLEKTSAKRSEWWGRNSRVMRWGLRNVHGSVVWLFYAVLLFLIIGTFHLEFHRGYDLWSAAPAGGGFIIVMFAFGRVTVETWQSCARKENGGTLGRVVARLGKGSVAMSCIVALVLSLFEAPIAAQAIAGTIEHVGTSPWEVRVDGTVLFLRGLFRPGIADATEDALRKNVGLKVVDLDSVGGSTAEAQAIGHAVQKYKLATRVSRLCGSACTDVFAAGQERLLLPPGRLGFHSCHPYFWFHECNKEAELEYFRNMGVEQDFIRKWQRVPNTGAWYPTNEELLAAHFITGTGSITPRKPSAHSEVASK